MKFRRPMHASGHTGPGSTSGIRPMNDAERVQGQIERGEVRTGPDAAREIAKRIENQGGFWGPPGNG